MPAHGRAPCRVIVRSDLRVLALSCRAESRHLSLLTARDSSRPSHKATAWQATPLGMTRSLDWHRSFLGFASTQTLAQTFHDLLNQRSIWPGKNKQIRRALSSSQGNKQVLRQKSRLVSHHRALQINRARKRARTFARHEDDFARLLVRREERAKKICWNAAAAAADAGRCPCDCLAENIFPAEKGCESSRQCERQFYRQATIG